MIFKIVMFLIVAYLASGFTCTSQYTMLTLPDGKMLQAYQFENVPVIGTDVSYLLVYQCVNDSYDPRADKWVSQVNCNKIGEAFGSSETLLENLFHGGAAGAAVGTGMALQDGDTITNTSTNAGNASAGANAGANSLSVSKSDALTVNRPAFNLPSRNVHPHRERY